MTTGSSEDHLEKPVMLATCNSGTDVKAGCDAAFKNNPAFLERFKNVVIQPFSSDVLARIAGKMAAKHLGDSALTKEQEKTLGEAVTAIFGGADEGRGMRGMAEKIETALAQPMSDADEERLSACSPAFAAKSADRRGDRLAEAFRRNIPVQAMKTLRLVKR